MHVASRKTYVVPMSGYSQAKSFDVVAETRRRWSAEERRQILEETLLFLVPLRLAGTTVLFGALAKLLADAGEQDRAGQLRSVVPATFEDVGSVTLSRADPTGSLTRATREVLSRPDLSSDTVDANADLEGALRAALPLAFGQSAA